jgi:hypothetical protein
MAILFHLLSKALYVLQHRRFFCSKHLLDDFCEAIGDLAEPLPIPNQRFMNLAIRVEHGFADEDNSMKGILAASRMAEGVHLLDNQRDDLVGLL